MATNNVINANVITPLIVPNGGTGANTLTLNGILVGNGTGAITALSAATDGQLVIGSTGNPPAVSTLTAGAGINITNGAGSITIDSLISQGIITLNGDTGFTVGTVVTLAGGNNMTTSASGSTVTFNVSGTTNHALQVGNALGSLTSLALGTTGQVLIGDTGANPVFAALGVNSGLTDHSLILSHNNSAFTALGVAADGQIPIGVTGSDPVLGSISAGTGISVVNGAGTITVSSLVSQGIVSLNGDTGSATGTTVTLDGVNNITTAASGSTVTFNLTGTTDHAVQVGNASGSLMSLGVGATGEVLIGSTGNNPAFGALGVDSGLTDHSLILSHNNSAFTALGAATNGQLPIGSTGADPVLATLTAGTGISITNGAGSITIDATVTGAITTLNGDTGSATGATVTLDGVNNITTTASGSTVAFNLTGTTDHAVQVGNSNGSLTSLGVGTTGQVLIGSTGANPAFGDLGVNSGLTDHSLVVSHNTGAFTALGAATNGQIPIGSTGADPVLAAITAGTGISVTNGAGSITIATGSSVASSFPTDSGTAIPSAGALTIGGGSNINTSGAGSTVTINLNNSPSVSGSLTAGTTVTGGTGIIATTGNINASSGNVSASGTVTAGTGLIATTGGVTVNAGNLNLPSTTSTSGNIKINNITNLHSYSGSGGGGNLFLGPGAGNYTLTTAAGNVIVGNGAGVSLTTGLGNLSMGQGSLGDLTTGNFNTGIGFNAGGALTTGVRNTFFGTNAGGSYTGAESSNIMVGNTGTLGESNTIRIGTQGAGLSQQNKCFVAGITGVTVASSATVLIDTTTGQLGTVVSSERYKYDVQDMNEVSDALLNLRPVTFKYNEDPTEHIQYGLIAEEVHEVMPDLVIYDTEGNPDSVAYHNLQVLLLNEIKKLVTRVNELETTVSILRERI